MSAHVLPARGLPYARRQILPSGHVAVTCPACSLVVSEADASAPAAAKLMEKEGWDPSKLAGLAYAEHFEAEARAGR